MNAHLAQDVARMIADDIASRSMIGPAWEQIPQEKRREIENAWADAIEHATQVFTGDADPRTILLQRIFSLATKAEPRVLEEVAKLAHRAIDNAGSRGRLLACAHTHTILGIGPDVHVRSATCDYFKRGGLAAPWPDPQVTLEPGGAS